MNVTRAQTEYLKRLIKGEQVVFCEGIEDKVGISDSKAIYFIPTNKFHLDPKDRKPFNAKSLLTDFDRGVLVERDGETKKTDDGEVVRFSNENTFVWVLKKYLFCFDKWDRYYAIAPNKPLYVSDEDFQIQAFILPYLPTD